MMGFNLTALVYANSCARGAARGVLLALAHKADDDTREAWPSVDTLLGMLGLKGTSRPTIFKALEELERLGEVERDGRVRGRSTRYRITLTGSEKATGSELTTGSEIATGPVANKLQDPLLIRYPINHIHQDHPKDCASKPKAEAVSIPEALDGDTFAAAWCEWLAYRRERRLTCTARTLRRQLDTLAGFGLDGALAAIDASIMNGWRGIFAPKPEALARARAEHAGDLLPAADKAQVDEAIEFLRSEAAQ